MDSIITIKNDMRDARPAENGRWEQGISITSEDRDIIVLGYNKAPEVGFLLLMWIGFFDLVADDTMLHIDW